MTAALRAAGGHLLVLGLLLALVLLLVRWQPGDLLWTDPGPGRWLAAGTCLLAYLGLWLAGALRRRHMQRARTMASPAAGDAPPTLLAYASQTGQAEHLARQAALALQAAAQPVRLLPLADVREAELAAAGRALFVVSTTGEGDPPDNAAGFARRLMGDTPPALPGLRYGLLALGDRDYRQFCGFGRALDTWLRRQGALPLFDTIEVDNGDDDALRRWHRQLEQLGAGTATASRPAFTRWRLAERHCLNPGSAGAPVFHLRLDALTEQATWTAGDIAEIQPRNTPEAVQEVLDRLALDGRAPMQTTDGPLPLHAWLAGRRLPDPDDTARLRGLTPQHLAAQLEAIPTRDYSIASIPAHGRLDLLLRQMRGPDGRLDLGSGWLTEHLPADGEVALRIRHNAAFHPPRDDRPMILIGNGTGLAGLRAHLQARAATGHHANWLLFGERSAAHDFFFRTEIEAWQRSGVLRHVDLAFSRDPPQRVYVQQRLRENAERLRAWIADGAAIYVCGSREGMAPAVTDALCEALGADAVARLTDEGRYRRDVY